MVMCEMWRWGVCNVEVGACEIWWLVRVKCGRVKCGGGACEMWRWGRVKFGGV